MHEWLMSGNAKHALALLDCYDAIYRPLLGDDRMSDYDRNDYIFGLLGDRTFDRTRALLPVPMNIVNKGIEYVSIWIRVRNALMFNLVDSLVVQLRWFRSRRLMLFYSLS